MNTDRWTNSKQAFWEDDSCKGFLKQALKPEHVEEFESYYKEFTDRKLTPDCYSSYAQCSYQYLFYALVRLTKPDQIVEIGVLEGFTSIAMGQALADNGDGKLCGYDLFENYPYRNDSYENVQKRIQANSLNKIVSMKQMDAFEVSSHHKSTDIVHIDISNDGKIVEKMFMDWKEKAKIIIFEGGSKERDNISWMKNYEKETIESALSMIHQENPEGSIYVIENYPSLTIAIKESYL